MTHSKGFSLLELIIVLVIIGVMAAAVTMSVSNSRVDTLKLEAHRLAARISLAQDEAVITNQQLGLEVNHAQYRFLVLEEDNWTLINPAEERQLVTQELPEGMTLQIQEEGIFAHFQDEKNNNKLFKSIDETERASDDDENEKILRPQVYLLSSGEINPFNLYIGYDDQEPIYYQLVASYDGNITINGPFFESIRYAVGRSL